MAGGHGLHGLWRGVENSFTGPLLSSFYDVKCDPGFHCVSKISDFGQHHDGNFAPEHVGKEAISTRFNGAYEVGCPARGFSFHVGECTDIGQGPRYHCWSPTRFEAGPDQPCGEEDSGKCLCVKTVSNQGDPINQESPNQASQVKQGEDLTTATWQVETYKQLKCRECSQHDQSQEDCIACAPKCDYGTKELAGLRITGCFDAEKHAFLAWPNNATSTPLKDPKAAKEQATERLKEATGSAPEGEAAVKKELQDYGAKAVPETELKQLSIIPHYRIWNPKEHDDLGDLKQPRAESGGYFQGQKLPWETNQRYLSARAWTKEFPHAAPQIQHLLDRVFQILAGKADLSQIPCDGQGNQSGGLGQLIIGTETAQKSCNDMQQTVRLTAQRVMCSIGKERRCAVDALTQVLKDPSEYARLLAADTFKSVVGKLEPRALKRTMRLVRRSSVSGVREAASKAMAFCQKETEAQVDQDPEVILAASSMAMKWRMNRFRGLRGNMLSPEERLANYAARGEDPSNDEEWLEVFGPPVSKQAKQKGGKRVGKGKKKRKNSQQSSSMASRGETSSQASESELGDESDDNRSMTSKSDASGSSRVSKASKQSSQVSSKAKGKSGAEIRRQQAEEKERKQNDKERQQRFKEMQAIMESSDEEDFSESATEEESDDDDMMTAVEKILAGGGRVR